MMKANFFLLGCLYLALLILPSCKTAPIPNEDSQWKSIYIEQFKLTYLRALLSKSYNKSKAIQEVINTDNSGFTEPVLTDDDHKLIDSLTTTDYERMRVDSIEGNKRAEGSQGKRPLQFVIAKLSDQSLEKLALKRFQLSGMLKSDK